jgi:acyl dehydratase
MFAAFSGDWHPLHVDEEYAKKGFFGQRIAHGFLVLSVATGYGRFSLLRDGPGPVHGSD